MLLYNVPKLMVCFPCKYIEMYTDGRELEASVLNWVLCSFLDVTAHHPPQYFQFPTRLKIHIANKTEITTKTEITRLWLNIFISRIRSLGAILGSLNILGHHHPPQYFQFRTPPKPRSPTKLGLPPKTEIIHASVF